MKKLDLKTQKKIHSTYYNAITSGGIAINILDTLSCLNTENKETILCTKYVISRLTVKFLKD